MLTEREYLVKESFSNALKEILLDKKFEDVTVTDIIDVSGLSRSTFYRHFQDKYELANWHFTLLSDLFAECEYSSAEMGSENIVKIIRHIEEDRLLYRQLLQYRGQNSLDEHYIKSSIQIARDIYKRAGKTLSLREQYIIRYHAGGLLSVIRKWLESEDPMSWEKVGELVNANRNNLIKAIYTWH